MDSQENRVARQYEDFPYPERRPGDERTRLIGTWLDDLGLMSHHCFRGKAPQGSAFRILVAGGGTGDGTIFLAEQLRGTGARIVHLDVSEKSIAIARERARIRGLSGIEWVHASLTELSGLGLGRFDYINCVGVLHHLEDPERGLEALTGVLAEGGALGLMVYGQYGRTGVYQMQSLLGMINRGVDQSVARLALTKDVLGLLPRGNWFKRGEELHPDHRTGGDAGIVDLLLHSQDRAYTVPQLYEWIEDRAGLHITFSDVHRGRLPYRADIQLQGGSAALLAQLAALGVRERHAIAELTRGDLTMHCFFATRSSDAAAPYGEPSFVPFFIREDHPASGADMAALVDRYRDESFLLRHTQSGLVLPITGSEISREIFSDLDGHRTFGEIFERIRERRNDPSLTDARCFEEFEPWFDALHLIDRLLLRRR